jgi:hypothetical protein
MAVRLSALHTSCPLPPIWFLVLIYFRSWVDSMAIVRLEGLRSTEKSNYLIWNRTCDPPACSIMPQPITLPRAIFLSSTLLFKEISGVNLYVIYSIHSINKIILCPRCNSVNHMSEEVFNSLHMAISIKVCPLMLLIDLRSCTQFHWIIYGPILDACFEKKEKFQTNSYSMIITDYTSCIYPSKYYQHSQNINNASKRKTAHSFVA